jgi:hypothetical protein
MEWFARRARFDMRIFLIIVGVIAALVLAVFAHDRISRYLSWRSLDGDKLVAEARAYTERYEIENVGMCLYVLDCSSGRARLQQVTDPGNWDFDVTRELIWERRFSDVCQAQTANIAVVLTSTVEENDTLKRWNNSGYWNFALDRFHSRSGNFHGGAISNESSIKACEPDDFILTVE